MGAFLLLQHLLFHRMSYIPFSGKILDDAKKISEYSIEEKNFVVVMVTKVCV